MACQKFIKDATDRKNIGVVSLETSSQLLRGTVKRSATGRIGAESIFVSQL